MKKVLFLLLFSILSIFPNSQVLANEKYDMNESVNIAYTIDTNYMIYCMLTMESILKHNDSNSHYYFHIVENNFADFHKWVMRTYAKYRNADIAFYRVSTDSFDGGQFLYTHLSRLTPIGMARIVLPSVLPKELHRVIYMDADMLVTTDMKELYDVNLGGYATGMVSNISLIRYPFFNFGKYYFNSGLIVMDLDKWRKYNIEGQLTGYLKKNLKTFIYEPKKPKKNLETAQKDPKAIATNGEPAKKKNKKIRRRIDRVDPNEVSERNPVDELIKKALDEKKKTVQQKGKKALRNEDEGIEWVRETAFIYPDQDLINVVLNKKIKPLNEKWNMQLFAIESIVDEDFEGIIHYIGDGKPWLNTGRGYISYKMYHENWKYSPLIIFRFACWSKVHAKEKERLYKDIIKMYKEEYEYRFE